MAKVVTFGEIMLRLAPEGHTRFVQAESFGATYSGGEANVAVSLSNFGIEGMFVTKLPTHEIGQAAVNSLRKYGVNISGIVRGGARVGIYYLEKGASQRPSKVVYDRAGSSIATATPADFNWPEIFKGADWFHFTGITPALGDSAAEICTEACKAAKAANMTVSCDLNYRQNLWSIEKASEVMSGLMQYVDVLISNEGQARGLFNIEAAGTDISYSKVAGRLAERFGFKQIALTFRESISADDNNWAGMLYDGSECCFSKEYALHIVDRVGGGDSFAAGLIYALLMDMHSQKAIEFAVAASALKHSIEGDVNLVSVDEVHKLADGDGSGRVQR